MRFDTSPDALMFACVRCVLALCSVLGVGVTVQYAVYMYTVHLSTVPCHTHSNSVS